MTVWYEINADLFGSMWLVAPMSATTRDVRVEDEPRVGDAEGRGGLASRERTVFRKVDGIHALGILRCVISKDPLG